jgi:hypothetical protein
LEVSGYLGDLNVWDSDGNRKGQVPICPQNRLIAGVLHSPDESIQDEFSGNISIQSNDSSQKLLVFNYYSNPNNHRNLNGGDLKKGSFNLPEWIRQHIDHEADVHSIDDFLFLTVATLRLNHINERSGEILDYLSNGLPGKGMGATSRAAKGFISKRIRTRSFANVLINSPQVFLPRHRGNQDGIVMCLGDVKLKSWFKESTIDEVRNVNLSSVYDIETEMAYNDKLPVPLQRHGSSKESRYWWRVLSVSVLGLGWRVNKGSREVLSNLLHIENPVNVHLQMQKPPLQENLPSVVHCKVTAMEFILRYSEYILLRAVLKENLMKKVDKTLWDNPEDTFTVDEDLPHKVRYSENARFVRYGGTAEINDATSQNQEVSTPKKVTTTLDLNLSLDGLALVLHRDDSGPKQKGNMMAYDIVLFEIDDIHLYMNLNSDSTKRGTIKLNSFALTDIGDAGRLAREALKSIDFYEDGLQRTRARNPSAFTVIAKGYYYCVADGDITKQLLKDPQLIISFDTNKSSSSDIDINGLNIGVDNKNTLMTSVRITLNHMNINPLIRPLREIADFISGTWTIEYSFHESRHLSTLEGGDVVSKINQSEEALKVQPEALTRKFRGMNISIITNYPRVFLVADETDQFTRALVLRGLTVVNATILKEVTNKMSPNYIMISAQCQVHSLESYINPEPRKVLEKSTMQEVVSGCKSYEESIHEHKNQSEDLGIALIEPVSATFTIRQLKRLNFPTLREAFFSIEPISTTLSFEDIKLLETVISKWKSERNRSKTPKTDGAADDFIGAFDATNDNESDEGVYIETHVSNSFYEPHDEGGNIRSEYSSFEIQDSVPFCVDCIPMTGEGHQENMCLPHSLATNLHSVDNELFCNLYEVDFHARKLGLALKKKDGAVVVEEITDDKLLSKIGKGDDLYSINGRLVSELSFQAILNLIAKSERPITIAFRKKMGVDGIEAGTSLTESPSLNSDRSKSEVTKVDIGTPARRGEIASEKSSAFRNVTTVSLRKGVSNGIEIEKSLLGDIPVVCNIRHSAYAECYIDSDGNTFLPRVGSLIIAIDGGSTLEMVHQEVLDSLRDHCEVSKDNELCDTYSLTFLELNPEDLGQVDKIDIVITGMKLTVIDDINGRDMPLLRKNLQSVAVKVERGVGLECNSIDVTEPFISIRPTPGYCQLIDCQEVLVELSEIITRFCLSAEISIDYYNARIAVWEPLVEPAHLSMEIESQKGRQSSPGLLSVAISDFQPSDICRSNQPFVCLNITHAAADILSVALREWQYWRSNPYEKRFFAQDMVDVANDSATHIINSPLMSTENNGNQQNLTQGSNFKSSASSSN